MSKIFYIIGKSSTGKDTIYKELLKNSALESVCLYTTRPQRSNEKEGEEYHFVSEEEYQHIKEKGLIIEERAYNTIHGIWRYFTVNDGQFDNEDKNYLIVGVLNSYVSTKDYFGEEKVIPLYIELDDENRLQRALIREKQQEVPRYAELCRRFLSDSEDFSEENIIKAGINRRFRNYSLDDCIAEIRDFIKENI